jgi:hypothetical protein
MVVQLPGAVFGPASNGGVDRIRQQRQGSANAGYALDSIDDDSSGSNQQQQEPSSGGPENDASGATEWAAVIEGDVEIEYSAEAEEEA